MRFVCKGGNKLDGASNFKAWKKIIDLVLIEDEVMGFVLGKVPELDKNNAQAMEK